MDSNKLEIINPDILVGATLSDTQTFTSSGTYTVPSNYTSVTVTLYGGGGAGGAGTTSGQGGNANSGGTTSVNHNGGTATTAAGGAGGQDGGNIVDAGGAGESSLYGTGGTGGYATGGSASGNAAGGGGGRNRGSWGGGSGGAGGSAGASNSVTYSVSSGQSINITIGAGGGGQVNAGSGSAGIAIVSATGVGSHTSTKILTTAEYNGLAYTVPGFNASPFPTSSYWSVATNIGTYAFCQAKLQPETGTIGTLTTSGANLTPSNAYGGCFSSPQSFSGTWRCMGYNKANLAGFHSGSKTFETTLWMRIL